MTPPLRACVCSMPSTVSISTPCRPSTFCQEPRIFSRSTRQFSNSSQHNTRLRARLHQWLDGPGRVFRDPLPDSTNYMSAYDRNGKLRRLSQQEENEESDRNKEKPNEQRISSNSNNTVLRENSLPPERKQDLRPFPLNFDFRAQPVLSEPLREQIFERAFRGESVVKISASLKVSLERVAAVVRLKEIEKKWIVENKPLAKAYSRAVLNMLQTTPVPGASGRVASHEPITDVPVHSATKRQIFQPVAESRHFTRTDAAAIFSPDLAPVDTRMPHQELVLAEKLRLQGCGNREISDATTRFVEAQNRTRHEAQERQEVWEKSHTTMHEGRRYDFRIREMNVEDVGVKGRSEMGVGWRYGFPHEDRKRGQVKIPTEVLA